MESAIFAAGGKQYRVKAGDMVDVELFVAQAGDAHVFNEILLLTKDGGVEVGAPHLPGVSVRATVLEQLRGEKIRIFKMRRRKKSRRTHGHRQYLTRVRIDGIDKTA
ncbi:MAG: 50S ribosomal protein L21 [Betaproteobacteria bacterium]|nr:50S ribosomal protein L21 [Betaproteobacteria bacterium]